METVTEKRKPPLTITCKGWSGMQEHFRQAWKILKKARLVEGPFNRSAVIRLGVSSLANVTPKALYQKVKTVDE